MAVSQMQRAQVFAHSSHRAQLIRDLQNLEIIHIVNLNEQEETAGEIPVLPESRETSVLEEEIRGIIRGIQGDLSNLQSTVDYLADFEQKKGFIAGLLGSRVVISSQEYSQLSKEIAHGEWRGVCNECRALEDQALNLTSREGRLKSDRANLQIWSNLDVPIEEIRDTEKTAIRIGVVPTAAYEGLLAEVNSSGVDVALETVGQTKTEVYAVVIFLQEDEQEATPILSKHGFSLASLPLSSGTVADRLKQIEEEFSQISAQRQEIAEKSAQLAVHRDNLMAVYDHISELLRQEQVRESFINTDHAFMIEGWVRKKDTKKLEEALSEKYDEVEVIFSEPSEDDEPPVDLEIKGPADPFQMVTKLYGTPNYREIDPTPLIAPFFAFFFGICLTDAGYGFLVALIAYFGARKLSGGGKNLFKLLIFAGIATIVVGSLTGGWFGIKPDRLPGFLKRLQVLDPQGQGQMAFMGAIVAIGFIQVWFGFFVKMYIDIKERDWAGAFLDQLPWLLAMIFITVSALLYWVVEAPMPIILASVAIGVLCCLVIVLFAGRESGNIVARLGTGGFELYTKLTGSVGDILSYLRLFALGLATGIIAGVVNTMASMMWGGFFGKVIAIGILVGGHIFNLVINALGGFIHTARLQFVEFFTKFYEGGGEEFRPFKKEHTYITVVDTGSPQESK